MRDLDRFPLTPLELERIESMRARARAVEENARRELHELHELSARGEASPLTFIEKIRALLPAAP